MLANCSKCGRVFQRIRDTVCPECVAHEDQLFYTVTHYLREHRGAHVYDVVEDTGVSIEKMFQWIESGRLSLTQFPNLKFPCERCGIESQAGRFCVECRRVFRKELADAMNTYNEREKHARFHSRKSDKE